MKLEGRLTILGDDEGVTIEVEDSDASTTFLRIELTPEQFCQAALGRLASLRCELEVVGLDHVGKRMELDEIVFPMPDRFNDVYDREQLSKAAAEIAKEVCPAGWSPATYFGSQDSFKREAGRLYARTTIRRWV
jgi:hypothetical protein